jgi:hypothetical protein
MATILTEAYIKDKTRVQQLVDITSLMSIIEVLFESHFKSILSKEYFNYLNDKITDDGTLTPNEVILVDKIKLPLSYIVVTNIIPQLSVSITAQGITRKSTNYDSAADIQSISLLQKSYKDIADRLMDSFKDWFEDNKGLYGVEGNDNCNKKSRTGGFYVKKTNRINNYYN